MKSSYLSVVLTLTCLLGLGEAARAQDAGRVVANVPFEFVAGGVTLPAGTYTVTGSGTFLNGSYFIGDGISPEPHPDLVLMRSNDKSVFLHPTVFDGAPTGYAKFDFEHVGDKYFLSKIETPDGVYTFDPAQAMTKVAKLKDHSALVSSGAN
jgi:hypothetical protein